MRRSDRRHLRSASDHVGHCRRVYHGVIHRTEDWPDATEELREGYRSPWLLGVFEGTKIGGLPRFIQGKPTSAGRFIAALGSISAAYSTTKFLNTLQSGRMSKWRPHDRGHGVRFTFFSIAKIRFAWKVNVIE